MLLNCYKKKSHFAIKLNLDLIFSINKIFYKMKYHYLLFLVTIFSYHTYSQRIAVSSTQSPTNIITNSLLNSGVCSSVSNVSTSPGVQSTGNTSPFGTYTNNGTANVFSQGLIISTGYATKAGNAVVSTTLSDNLNIGGDADLAAAFNITAPAVLSDAAYIEFDFVPIRNSISFRYFLASEEYQFDKNYPCQFSDAFAFLLKDQAVGTYQNIALVPGTNIPVGISTVRPDLTGVTGGGGCPAANAAYFNGYNQNPPNFDGTNFNGSTVALTAAATVIPGHTYHIKLVIADYGATGANYKFDSAVFLEAGSFNLSGYFTDQYATTLIGSAISCSSNPLVIHQISQILHPTYQWFKDNVAIPAPLGTASTYQIPVGGTGNYKLVITDALSGCVDTIPNLFVTVIDAPTAPSPQSFCVGKTVADLIAVGTNIKWYTAMTGGTALTPTTVLVAGTYYASQTVGSCETTRVAAVVILGSVTTTFAPIAPICFGTTTTTLPIISNENVGGSWSPSTVNNTNTTTYNFTPNSGQCATTAQLTIVVNPLPTVVASNVQGCSGGNPINLVGSPAGGIYSIATPYSGTANTTYTYTYSDGNGCTATSTSATITINPLPIVTATNVTGCSGTNIALSGFTASSGGTGAYSITNPYNGTVSTTYTYSYTDGNGCSATSSSANILISPAITPDFTQVNPICAGDVLNGLPTTSNNAIDGSWMPALNNLQTTLYTFTPSTVGCVTQATMNITVNQKVTPTFTPQAPFCIGQNVPSLPAQSLEGITGLWTPSTIDSTQTATYIFTSNAGQCATNGNLTITVQSGFDFDINGTCINNNFVATVTAVGQSFDVGTASYSWEWVHNTDVVAVGSNSSSFNVTEFINAFTTQPSNPSVPPISFNIKVTTIDGCIKTKSITFDTVFCGIQKGISANNDGLNDYFDLRLLNVKHLSIFNRYGMKVYSKDNYTNEWYGQSDKGDELPDSTYYYLIDFNDSKTTKTGWIYINRAK